MTLDEQEVRDAAWNAVAVASTALERERAIFAHTLHLAREKGLTLDDLVRASGWSETDIASLIAEVA